MRNAVVRAVVLLVGLAIATPGAAQEAAKPPAAQRPGPSGIVAEPDRWQVLEPGGLSVKRRNPLYDPYNPNVLKGDYPLFGDKTFFAFTATLDSIADFKRNLDFYQTGRIRNIPFHEHNTIGQLTGVTAFEIFHGDTVFAPKDWAVRLTPIVRWRCGDLNAVDHACGEDIRMLEAFGEAKLFEVGQTFDATSGRLGLQFFNSDFFGFIYNDVQPGVRVFGELARNRYKFNLAAFDRLNKEKLSGLNEFKRREHQVGIANVQWDDFIFPGFNVLPSFHYNHDDILDGTLRAYYAGFTTNGHIGPVNVNSAMYYVFGDTAKNTPNKKTETISAGTAFGQLTYPTKYYAPRLAVGYGTGDRDPNDGKATGFDSIFDNVAFGGGQFSYLFGEKIQFGATTVLRGNSIYPSLRGANATSQFVNPGVLAINPGIDVAVTPKTIFELNYNAVWFDHPSSLERLTRKKHVSTFVGHEANAGFTYRPFLNEQVIVFAGGAVLFPGQGVQDVFGDDKNVYKALVRLILTY